MNESKLITGDWAVTAPTDKGPRLVDEPLVFSSKEKHGTRHREIQKASVAAGFRCPKCTRLKASVREKYRRLGGITSVYGGAVQEACVCTNERPEAKACPDCWGWTHREPAEGELGFCRCAKQLFVHGGTIISGRMTCSAPETQNLPRPPIERPWKVGALTKVLLGTPEEPLFDNKTVTDDRPRHRVSVQPMSRNTVPRLVGVVYDKTGTEIRPGDLVYNSSDHYRVLRVVPTGHCMHQDQHCRPGDCTRPDVDRVVYTASVYLSGKDYGPAWDCAEDVMISPESRLATTSCTAASETYGRSVGPTVHGVVRCDKPVGLPGHYLGCYAGGVAVFDPAYQRVLPEQTGDELSRIVRATIDRLCRESPPDDRHDKPEER